MGSRSKNFENEGRMANEKESLNNSEESQLALKILSAVKSLKYGTVQITIHNGRVTQIDKVERIRLTKEEPAEKSGS